MPKHFDTPKTLRLIAAYEEARNRQDRLAILAGIRKLIREAELRETEIIIDPLDQEDNSDY